MAQEPTKKTGMTPLVEDGISKGELLGPPVPVRTVLVRYKDGHGQEATKLAIVIPGGEIYFHGKDAVDTRPVQRWLKAAIIEAMKE